jgi:hypothetical protein
MEPKIQGLYRAKGTKNSRHVAPHPDQKGDGGHGDCQEPEGIADLIPQTIRRISIHSVDCELKVMGDAPDNEGGQQNLKLEHQPLLARLHLSFPTPIESSNYQELSDNILGLSPALHFDCRE